MSKLVWSFFFIVLLVSGCSSDGNLTRHNDFTPLTSIKIVAISPTIAAKTSTKLSVTGDYSGLYTRDITDQVVWSSDLPTVADFATTASPNRVTGHATGIATLTATVGGPVDYLHVDGQPGENNRHDDHTCQSIHRQGSEYSIRRKRHLFGLNDSGSDL